MTSSARWRLRATSLAFPETRATWRRLGPILRVYEGCARALLGGVEGASVLKLHRYLGKVTYLVCPGLDTDPDPRLELRLKVTLPALAIDVFDYSRREDPPRLGIEPARLRRAEE